MIVKLASRFLITAFVISGSGAAAQTAVFGSVNYLPAEIDLTRLLPPPPAAGSPEEKKELAAMLAMQESRTPARAELAIADSAVNLNRFAGVLGPKFKPEALPVTTGFFGAVGRSTGRAMNRTKDCWLRPRPFEVDERIQPAGELKAGIRLRRATPRADVPLGPGAPCVAGSRTPEYVWAYPSGHASWGAMTAILLAEMVPEKRAELYARGWEFGESRVVGGVHFPSDVEAARIQATVLVALMMLNDQFKSDLAKARAELRAALGLTAASNQ